MLFIVDTTGTQTNCPRPLSRKKLRQLCPQSHAGLTRREMFSKYGRTSAKMRKELKARKEYAEKMEALRATNAIVKPTPEAEPAKPSIFARLSGFFGGLKRKAERTAK
jgi:hypothetical protein